MIWCFAVAGYTMIVAYVHASLQCTISMEVYVLIETESIVRIVAVRWMIKAGSKAIRIVLGILFSKISQF